jgi:hypothetical protein
MDHQQTFIWLADGGQERGTFSMSSMVQRFEVYCLRQHHNSTDLSPVHPLSYHEARPKIPAALVRLDIRHQVQVLVTAPVSVSSRLSLTAST